MYALWWEGGIVRANPGVFPMHSAIKCWYEKLEHVSLLGLSVASSLCKGLSFQKFKIDFWRKEVKSFLANQETDSFDEMSE